MHGEGGSQLGGGFTEAVPAPCWGCGGQVIGRRRAGVTVTGVFTPVADGLCAGCRRRWGSMGRHPSCSGDLGLATTVFPVREPLPGSTN
jgi:hypothetical protein